MVSLIPPRHARKALQEIFPKGYWLGERPDLYCSYDIPAYILKKDPIQIFFARNPYSRIESMHRSFEVRKLEGLPGSQQSRLADFKKFVEWLLGSGKAGHFAWTQQKWIEKARTIKGQEEIKFDPDLIIQIEDLATGVNSLGVLKDRLGEDDVPYVINEVEVRHEFVTHNYDWRNQYDKETIKKVRKAYYDDFDLCGYSTSIDDALESPDISQ